MMIIDKTGSPIKTKSGKFVFRVMSRSLKNVSSQIVPFHSY